MTQPDTVEEERRMRCRDAVELLPWLLNGSLEEPEQRALVDHLAGCAACGRELADTAQAWEIFAEHIPTLALAEHAQGLAPAGLDRELVDRHLERCPSCRQELEAATSDRLLDFQARGEVAASRRGRAAAARDHRVPLRHLAIAAGTAAVLASGGLIWSLVGPRAPTGDVANIAAAEDRDSLRRPARPGDRTDAGTIERIGLFHDGFEAGSTKTWRIGLSHDGFEAGLTKTRRIDLFNDGFEAGSTKTWSTSGDNQLKRRTERRM